jgi:hypothetical protein
VNADVKSKIVVANDRMSALAEIGLRRGEEEAHVEKKNIWGFPEQISSWPSRAIEEMATSRRSLFKKSQ